MAFFLVRIPYITDNSYMDRTNTGNQTMTDQEVYLSFGGGVDSSCIAAMDLNRPLAAKLLGISLEELNAALPTFDNVVFADLGAETESTDRNVARFVEAFEEAGKTVHIVRRHEVVNQRSDDQGITDWLLRLGTVPVMGGGPHACSKLFKGDTIEKAVGAQHFIIGVEANEGRRLVFTPPKGGSTFSYPLVDLGITREMCLELLPQLGFAGVTKSSCVFCPFKSEEELREMYNNDARDWALCRKVEENFRVTSPVKHQAWLDAGQPLNAAGRAPEGMWRLDSWAEGRRLFVKRVGGRQLSIDEWAAKFDAEEASQANLIPIRITLAAAA